MDRFRLTQQQLNYFDTFGFLSLPGLMADSIEEITDAFEQIWSERGGGHNGKPHDGLRRSNDGHLAEPAAKARKDMGEPSRG